MAAAVAIHVADEALTGFLALYNPLVLQIRERLRWFPAPTFTFPVWLGGLAAGVSLLVMLAPAVKRGMFGTRLASYVLSALMILNGLGHILGSIYFGRLLPGIKSAPLLLASSLWLLHRTLRRKHLQCR
ncbi:MAG: hypothetical protein U0Q16_21550 [Bryobacteraceae bacterium]